MRAMPSPSCRTVPTSDKSVCTSYCSIRALRICVISSGRSCTFLLLAGRGELSAKSFEAAADARVDAHRAGLENDAADQVRVDRARRVDGAPGGALDLLDDLPRLVVRQLVGRRELDREPALELRDEALERAVDLAQLAGAVLLDREAEEVAYELVGSAEHRFDRVRLRTRIDLRIAEQRVELRDLVERGGELAEVGAHLLQMVPLLRGLEERAGVREVSGAHSEVVVSSRREKSSESIASSISRRWSASVSTLPVTFDVAINVRSATSARIWPSARWVSATICRFVSSRRRCRSCSSSSRARSRSASASRRTSLRISSASWRARPISARCSSSRRRASSRARSASAIDSRIRSRRSSSIACTLPNAKRLRT